MKSNLLSTASVASMLKVNESTVKRWTEKGSLRCIKTPGGHRKYKMKDVVAFMDQFAYDVTDLLVPAKDQLKSVNVSTDYALLTKDFPALSDLFFNTALEGNREHTFQFLHLLYANRITQAEIYDRVVFPAFAKIGMQWSAGNLGIEQEHLASNTAMHAIIKLQDHITKKPSHGKIAVCGCLEEEYHEIGITCVNNILESNGWTTYYLGTNLPTESFIDAIEQYVPALVCVSSTVPKTKRYLTEACAAIHETTQIIGAKLVVGGLAAGDDMRKKLRADHIPHSIGELMSFVSTLS
ncbi:MAG: cobalamin-dependent protein [Bacteroidetes bacterium]|nr:cobalamin-dependent protein [Bacteroidota bacterium]